MYRSFEEEADGYLLRGKVLETLEYTKIIRRLIETARTPFGREACTDLLPSGDFNTVAGRLRETEDTVSYFGRAGRVSISGINDIRQALHYASSGGTLSMKDLLDVAGFLRAVERIAKTLDLADIDGNAFCERLRLLALEPDLEKEISFCIISEEEMNDRASDELYLLRRKIRDAQTGIRDTLEKMIRSHSTALQEQLVTIRNDRYVVPVKAEKRSEIAGIVHDTSSSGQTIFVEPIAVVEANNRIREHLAAEREEIHRILTMLSARVLTAIDMLRANIALVGEIDFLAAKAELSASMKATVPILNREGRIILRKARHPLIPDNIVVPIDFEVGVSFRTLVVTGPNTGGKTVSLKTCGLLTLMTMAGLAIPCLDHSEVSVFGKVLADIGDEQSIEQSLSTFSSHMRNLVSILEEADETTLVLVDELGSGTDPSEGAALATAILDEFYKRGAVTVATTHYKELKGYAINTEGVENACCEFDTDTLSPTYRLLIGLPGVSNAFVISQKLGLPEPIIQSARTFLSQEGIRFEELLSAAEQKNRESEKLRKEIRDMRDIVKKQTDDLERQRIALEDGKRKILDEAREEKKEIIESTLDECDRILGEVRAGIKAKTQREAEDTLRRIRSNLRAGLNDLEAESRDSAQLGVPGERPDELRLGEKYFSDKIGGTGLLVKLADRSGSCVIESGGVRVTVPSASLRIPEEDVPDMKARSVHKNRAQTVKPLSSAEKLRLSRAQNTVTELMLIGKNSEEATIDLDRYLDDCVLSGIRVVRIVHGKGSGILRSAVASLLKKDPRVKTFRLGGLGEGGDGVTIAEL
ncbi:MAG: endonuclease MutS2 [Oscillospiraceae bacterium]|nr:endonuclease MutS2 [Oscillospiraceae bacterium]